MTRHTQRAKARVTDLTEELALGAAIRLRTDADSIRHIVDAVVAYLLEEYPSQDLYIPGGTTYPVEQIKQAMRQGRSMRWICSHFKTDRRTIYRLLDSEGDAKA